MTGNFDSIINENRPVIVDFHAVWCGPCKTQSPILKQLAEELGERVRVIKIEAYYNLRSCTRCVAVAAEIVGREIMQ